MVAGLALTWAADPPDHVPGRLIVGARQSAEPALAARTLQLHRAVVRKQIPALGASVVDVPEESSDAIIESLRRTGLYDYVERDYYAHTATTPNDPLYGSQWHLPQIKAPQAWALTTGAASVVIAVIDSGVDTTHPDLSSKLLPGWNFVSNTATIVDYVGHGTAVSGTVAAASNNSLGVSGVNWSSMIMPLVVVDSNDYASYSNIAAAIQYAADHGARVINLSVGGSSPSSTLQNAVNYAWSKGLVLFASAMNNSTSTPYYPAACSNVVAVSATDNNDNLAGFSNYGSWITLAAPGTNILTTTVGGGTGYWYGTSFSSPIAAGVAALALAVNPALTNSALVTLMEQNTDDIGAPGFDTSFGWGRVNAYKTVTAAQAGLSPVTVRVSPSSGSLSAGQSLQLTASVTGSTSAASWSLSSPVGFISPTGLYTAPGSVTTRQTVTVNATTSGVTASASIVLNPPTISVTPATTNLSGGQTVQLSAAVTGTTNAVAWSLNPAVGTITAGGLYTAPASIAATQTVIATASVAGISASASITLNQPAVTISAFTPIRVNAGGGSYVDSLGQTWSADKGFSGGATWSVANTISGTTTQPLYQNCRYGVFSYQFAVPNGTYLVKLKFAEVSQTSTGRRVFNVALNGAPALAAFDIFAQAGGEFIALDKLFPITVANGQINIQFSLGSANLPMISAIEILSSLTTTSSPSAFTPIRVNAGGGSYVDSLGQTWSADPGATGGAPWAVVNTISGTTAQPLYQNCRYGAFSYQFTVPNGTYTVNLKFAEISQTAAGRRQFNVGINGSSVLTNFDVFAQSGGEFVALDKPFAVSVTNGQISIQFTSGAANLPIINAIEILAASTSTSTGSTFTPVRINAGGASMADSLAQTWSADQSFIAGYTWSVSNPIAGTTSAALYQTCRYGTSFSYQVAVPNGTYTVNLKFAEVSQTAAGQRLFNVAINGTQVLTDFDIFAQAGGAFVALDKPFSVNVTNGQINLQFTMGSANLPMINAIEITGGGSTGAVTAVSGPMHHTR
jgi:subtilisin family serine protease